MLAGLEEVDTGSIHIGTRDVTDDDPKDRDVAMVFQNYALYPHMTVAQNMGFALKIAGVSKAERQRRVQDVAKLLDLESYLARKPKDLSGGQRQRVAMGRAIVRRPQVFSPTGTTRPCGAPGSVCILRTDTCTSSVSTVTG
jgi:multiple sugar transport system ATP-binding protein